MLKLSGQPIQIVLSGCLIPTAILSIGILWWRSYPLELLSNFRVYYFLMATAIAIACCICQIKGLRTGLLLWLSLGLITFNSVWIFPWYLPHSQQGSGNTIRVLTFNINVSNDRWDAIANAIRTEKPDIAAIIESSIESKEELTQRFTNLLPFVYRSSSGGLTIFSRFPLISSETKIFDNGEALVTSLQINQKVVEVIAVHPSVPVKPSGSNAVMPS